MYNHVYNQHVDDCTQCKLAIYNTSNGKSIAQMQENCCDMGKTIYGKFAHNEPGYAGIDLHRIRLGMTRDQIVELFGEPDAKSIGTRKYKIPLIYKYGIYELTFDRYKDSGLIWVFDDDHNKML